MKLIIGLFITLAYLLTGCSALQCEHENFLGITLYKTCPGPLDSSDMIYCCGTKGNRVCCNQFFGFGDQELNKIVSKLNTKVKNKRSAVNISTEAPIDSKNVVTQKGLRDNAKKFKTKVKEKLNSTLTKNKDKIKTKVKDKIKKDLEKKLDPTGGHMKLPAIIGTLFAVAIGLIVLCIVCCCCCPFCLLHKRRTRGVVHNPPPGGATYYYPVPPQAQMQSMNAPPPAQGYAPVQPGVYPPQQQYAPQGYPPQPMPQPQQAQAPYPTSYPPPPQPQNDNPPPYAEKQMPYNPNY